MKVAMQFGFDPIEGSRGEREILACFALYLKKSGVEVVIPREETTDLSGFDVVHLFGMGDSTHLLSRLAVKSGVPTVVTPLYWNENFPIYYSLESLESGKPEIIETPLTDFYFQKKSGSNVFRQYMHLIESAAAVTTSGECERLQIFRDFNVPAAAVVDLPVGIDLAIGIGRPEPFIEKYKIENFILSVGGISERKGQHNLIEAARETGVPLVLVGPAPAEDDRYSNYCREIASDSVLFINSLDAQMLKSAYQAAAVFALPSKFELPGMAYMPAALAATPIVATNRGAAWDYLGENAHYCEPDEPDTVTAAVREALAATPDKDLKKRLLMNFSWGKTTVELIRLYQKIATK